MLVDCDDGYGDAKNVARTIRTYEKMGAAAIFIEDQVAPKRCGHMAGKSVIPAEVMATKLRAAAAAARANGIFLMARTDARAVHGLDDALRRGELYLKAGADGLFIEAPQSPEELARVGAGVPPRAADGQYARRRAHAAGTPGGTVPPRLRHGRLSDQPDLPGDAHHRKGARRSEGRPPHAGGRRSRF